MKAVLISDTHSLHGHFEIPPCDLLIHAGDFCGRGEKDDAASFLDWFESQPAKHRVFIAGNHDVFCEQNHDEFAAMVRGRAMQYLNDSGVEINGFKLWGSPVTPRFFDWSFNRDRGPAIRRHWDLIPRDTQILITHGPPLGIGDMTRRGDPAGCADLLDAIREMSGLRLHVFGHIHEGYGVHRRGDRGFINASMLTDRYRPDHRPIEIEL